MNEKIELELMIIFGPPGTTELLSLINSIAENENVSSDIAWNIYVENLLFNVNNPQNTSKLIDDVFSTAMNMKVKIKNLFYTHMTKDGHSYPGVIIKLDNIISKDPQTVNSFFSDKENRDLIGAMLGNGLKNEWVYVSLSAI